MSLRAVQTAATVHGQLMIGSNHRGPRSFQRTGRWLVMVFDRRQWSTASAGRSADRVNRRIRFAIAATTASRAESYLFDEGGKGEQP